MLTKQKYKKQMARILTALLVVAVGIGFVPQMNAPAYAEDSGTPAIQLVQNGTAPNIPGGQGGSTEGGVYFGNYKQSSNGNGGFRVEPVKWRVLANADGKLFLLSDRCLDILRYSPSDSTTVTWETSIVRAWLNGLITEGGIDFTDDNFIDGAFSDKEQDAIATTSVKDDHPTWSSSSNDTEDQLFLLSDGEVQNTAYGFIDDNAREAEATDYAASMSTIAHFWWLRSLNDHWNNYYVYPTGFLGEAGQTNPYGVRPAFNLDLSSVLFTSAPSASDGGKVSGDVGANALTTVSAYSGSEWKVTVKDGDHADFDVSKVTPGENNVTVEYKKAKTGQDEYISAIITDKPITEEGAAIKYYGKIAEASGDDNAAGTVTINTADKLEAGDTLYVFNEQDNGDKMTDYASALQEVKLYQITFHPNNGNPTFTETVEAGGFYGDGRSRWNNKNGKSLLGGP